jgi:DNA-binding FadR family transcriptional regulator
MPVQAGRASEEIALQVEAAIVDGRLAPGGRLPSEREMQSQFGTGRGVIREATKGGAYVRQLDVGNVSESLALFLKQHPMEPEKVIEFRESLDRTITQLAIAHADQAEKDELLKEALRLETMLQEDEPDLIDASELDRQLNIKLARMARNPLFEWVMHALQMGFSSHDYALYEDRTYRIKAGANWSNTARAIANGEIMRALAYNGHHYVLLRQCIDEKAAPASAPNTGFLQEDNQ